MEGKESKLRGLRYGDGVADAAEGVTDVSARGAPETKVLLRRCLRFQGRRRGGLPVDKVILDHWEIHFRPRR